MAPRFNPTLSRMSGQFPRIHPRWCQEFPMVRTSEKSRISLVHQGLTVALAHSVSGLTSSVDSVSGQGYPSVPNSRTFPSTVANNGVRKQMIRCYTLASCGIRHRAVTCGGDILKGGTGYTSFLQTRTNALFTISLRSGHGTAHSVPFFNFQVGFKL